MQASDIAGRRFGKWQVIERSANSSSGKAYWLCECDCGTRRAVSSTSLVSGKSLACGCVASAKHTKHGLCYSTERNVWTMMIQRCTNPKHTEFPEYGGRGINVCERWRLSLADFVSDVGRRQSPQHTLDRYPNNDGNYEPSNVRWATVAEQARNKRNNRMLTYKGESLCAADWADRCGLSRRTMYNRLRLGWCAERAIETPPSPTYKRK